MAWKCRILHEQLGLQKGKRCIPCCIILAWTKRIAKYVQSQLVPDRSFKQTTTEIVNNHNESNSGDKT